MNSIIVQSQENGDKLAIYQCANCRNVLGNDTQKSEENRDDKVIYFRDIDNCLMQTSLKISKERADLGCRYRNLECCECHYHLGRQYCKVTKEHEFLDGINAILLSAVIICHIKAPSSRGESNQNVVELQKRVDTLEHKLADISSKIDDLAVACVEACKDRFGIKEAVANLLMVVSNELDAADDMMH